MSIYNPFKKKIDAKNKDHQFRVIISFENLSHREEFKGKYKDLDFLGKFDFIPSICVILNKEQIFQYEKEKIIKQLEEDQKIHLSLLDVLEIIKLNEYRNSHIVYNGRNVNIGIIDNGINKEFPSITNLKSYIKDNDNFDEINSPKTEISHGTVIASIISNQFKDINDDFIGIAPNANLIDLKLIKSSNEYYFSDVLEIFEKINKSKIDIDILLISLTSKEPSDGQDILSLACNKYVDNGLIVVSPAGNFGPDPHSIGSPGAALKVITIGGLTKELTIPNFSGRGPTLDNRIKPDLCLPSTDIIVPLSENLRVKVSGTSVSASIGAGIIALIKEFDPQISNNDIIDLIKKTSINLKFDHNDQGLGTIDVSNLFKELDLFHEKLIPYNYLVKRSIKLSIEMLVLFLILFYLFYFIKISLF